MVLLWGILSNRSGAYQLNQQLPPEKITEHHKLCINNNQIKTYPYEGVEKHDEKRMAEINRIKGKTIEMCRIEVIERIEIEVPSKWAKLYTSKIYMNQKISKLARVNQQNQKLHQSANKKKKQI